MLPVYLGVVLDDGEENSMFIFHFRDLNVNTDHLSAQHAGPKAVKGVFIAFIVVVTIAAGRIIGGRVKKIKPEVIYERRKARYVAVVCPNRPVH